MVDPRRLRRPCIAAAFASPGTAFGEPSVTACLDAAEQGQTLRDSGAYLRARDRFVACAGDECPGEVRKRCVDWLEDVEKLLPTVVFGAQQGTGEVADVRVLVDGALAAERPRRTAESPSPSTRGNIASVSNARRGGGRRNDGRRGPRGPEAAPHQRPLRARAALAPPLLALRPPKLSPSPPNSALVYSLGALAVASLATGAALDISGFVFVQQCGSDASCSRNHEIAEANWRFSSPATSFSASAPFLPSPHGFFGVAPHGAPPSSAVALDVVPSRTGATLDLVTTF